MGREERAGLGVEVLPVGGVNLSLLEQGEVEEVRRAMDLVVKLLGVGELQLVLHVGVVANTWKKESITHLKPLLPPPLIRSLGKHSTLTRPFLSKPCRGRDKIITLWVPPPRDLQSNAPIAVFC